MNTNIYIVEDHSAMQQALRVYLRQLTDVSICGVAGSAQEALAALPAAAADLVLVDVSLPDMSGIDLVEQLCSLLPTLRCLMLSGHQEIAHIQRALAVGARGYLIKGNSNELAPAIEQVLAGDIYLSEVIRQNLGEIL